MVAVCGRSEHSARTLADEFGIPRVAASLDDLLAMDDVDAVIVATPNAAHAPVAIAAAEKGRHVLCEKPMARTAAEARAMFEASEAAGTLLMVGLVRRFEERCRVAREIIESGALGDIYAVHAAYVRRDGQPGGWFATHDSSGGGSLIDIGIHSLDLALHLCEFRSISRVSGFTRRLPGIMDGIESPGTYRSSGSASVANVEDHAYAMLRTGSGAVVTIEAAWAQHRESDAQHLQIYGTRGSLQVDPSLRLFHNHGSVFANTDYPCAEPIDRLQAMFNAEVAHFASCIDSGEPCQSPAADGVALMEIIDAVYDSAREGREVELA